MRRAMPHPVSRTSHQLCRARRTSCCAVFLRVGWLQSPSHVARSMLYDACLPVCRMLHVARCVTYTLHAASLTRGMLQDDLASNPEMMALASRAQTANQSNEVHTCRPPLSTHSTFDPLITQSTFNPLLWRTTLCCRRMLYSR